MQLRTSTLRIIIHLDPMQLTNEFKFPFAALHHADETYLVPDLLKKAYGWLFDAHRRIVSMTSI